MARKSEVKVGQQYREPSRGYLGGLGRCWMVERVALGVDGQLHAVVSSVDATHTRKTLAVAVLLDRKRYQLIAEPESRAA
jgi:hypothetical protein